MNDKDKTREELMRELENLRGLLEKGSAQQTAGSESVFPQGALDVLTDAFLVFDFQGRFLHWNRAVRDISGYTDREISSMNPLDFFAADERQRVANAIALAMTQGHASLESSVITKEGKPIPFEFTGDLLKDHVGKPIGICVVGRDITRRKKAEEALLESEARYRSLMEAAPDPIVVYDIEGIPLYLNPAFTRVFGWTFEEARGKTINFVPPENWPETKQHIDKIVKGEDFPDSETRRYRRDGSVIDVSVSGSTILDGKGCAAGSVIQLRDITARKHAEQAIKESEERYRLLTQNSLTGIYIHQDGRFVYVNERLAEILGWSPEEMIGKEFWRFVHPEDLEMVKTRGMARSLGEQAIPQYEFRVVCKDGTTKWLDVLATTIMFQGRPANMGNVADITDRKGLEEQLRQALKMEAIGRLAGGIAHDFNNLLTAMIGYSNMLLQVMPKGDSNRDKIMQISRAADRAAELTRQLLAFSRKQVLKVAVIDLNEVVADLEKMLRRLIREDIRLVTALRASPALVCADPGQVEQVMINLTVNARDAMPEGGTLIIETANVELDEGYTRTHTGVQQGMYVMLAFSDSGQGMDTETLSHIFEPFFTTKPKGKGTGLGLSTVYGIVKQHDGHIEAYSEPGRGATFKVFLPCVDALSERVSKPPASQPPRPGTETVLIVEDEEIVLNIACETLQMAGYRTLRASDPEQATELCRSYEGTIHLVLTDVVLPRMDGRTLFGDLAAIRPGMKVLYMSGYTANAIVHHGVLEDGLHFLQKPFTMDELARIVREVLDDISER